MLILGKSYYSERKRTYKVFDTADSTYLTITSKQLKELLDNDIEIVACPKRNLEEEIQYNLLSDVTNINVAFKYPSEATSSVGLGNTSIVTGVLFNKQSFDREDFFYIIEYTYIRAYDPEDYLANSVFLYGAEDGMYSDKVTQLWYRNKLLQTHIGTLLYHCSFKYKDVPYLLLYYMSSADDGDITHDRVNIFKKYCYYLINLDTLEEVSLYDDLYPFSENWLDYDSNYDYRLQEADFFMIGDNVYDCYDLHRGYYFLGGNDDDTFEYVNAKTGKTYKKKFIAHVSHEFERVADEETAKVRNAWNVIAPKYLINLNKKMKGIMSDLEIFDYNQITGSPTLLTMYLTWLCKNELQDIEEQLDIIDLHIELNYYVREVHEDKSSDLHWELFYLPSSHIGQGKYYPQKYFLATCGQFKTKGL